jgi:predicted transcriptional regulator of viral defense system
VQPSGVICYFSAITYYDLSTQFPTHHHIAWFPLKPANPGATVKGPVQNRKAAERNPLGVEKFRFQGVPYFLTKRDPALLAGVQRREVSRRTCLRITTLEQTLLDTLLQPVRSGGEAVIFEAWEKALEQLDPDRMAQHLTKIDRPFLDRRVAAMLEMLGARFESTPLEACDLAYPLKVTCFKSLKRRQAVLQGLPESITGFWRQQ